MMVIMPLLRNKMIFPCVYFRLTMHSCVSSMDVQRLGPYSFHVKQTVKTRRNHWSEFLIPFFLFAIHSTFRERILWLFASCAFVLVPSLILHLTGNLWPLPFLCYLLYFAFFMHCPLLCTSLTTSLQIHLLRPCSHCSALFSKPLDPRLLSWPRAGSTGKVYRITTLKSVSCCLRIRWIPQFFIIPWDGLRLTRKWFESYRTSRSAPCRIYLSQKWCPVSMNSSVLCAKSPSLHSHIFESHESLIWKPSVTPATTQF